MLDPKEAALYYQGHARHYAHWQMDYRRKHMLQMSIKMQREAAIAADTAMDYLMILVDE